MVSVLKPVQEKDEGIARAGGWLKKKGAWERGLRVNGSVSSTRMRNSWVSEELCGASRRIFKPLPPRWEEI